MMKKINGEMDTDQLSSYHANISKLIWNMKGESVLRDGMAKSDWGGGGGGGWDKRIKNHF